MDTPQNKKRQPDSSESSILLATRKSPKVGAPADSPYDNQPPSYDEPELTAEEIAQIEQNRLAAIAKKTAFDAKKAGIAATENSSPASPKKPNPFMKRAQAAATSSTSAKNSPVNGVQTPKITSFFQKAQPTSSPAVSSTPAAHVPDAAPSNVPAISVVQAPVKPSEAPRSAFTTPTKAGALSRSHLETPKEAVASSPVHSASPFSLKSTSQNTEPHSPFRRSGTGLSTLLNAPLRSTQSSHSSTNMDVDVPDPAYDIPQTNAKGASSIKERTAIDWAQFSADSPALEPVKSDPKARAKLLASLTTVEDEPDGIDYRPSFMEKPRDFSRKLHSEEGANLQQLYIPPADEANFTAAKAQYWKYKKAHYDEIVFFQQGDFFNLFYMDAQIGKDKLGLAYNGEKGSVGFNRRQLHDWATKFAKLGYKVTVMAQTTTAVTEEEKLIKKAKKGTEDRKVTDKVTAGTISDFEMFDQDSTNDSTARYLLVLAERFNPTSNTSTYGVSFIDTSTYEWRISHFLDDANCSQLETILLRIRPREVLFERLSGLSKKTRKLLDVHLTNPCLSFLDKFPDMPTVHSLLGEYFNASSEGMESSDRPSLPSALASLLANDTHDSQLEIDLALTSVGATIIYFKELNRTVTTTDTRVDSHLDKEIIARARYERYSVFSDPTNSKMILDAVALMNLEILENNDDSSSHGTLLEKLDHTVTAFGRRRLKQWIVHPLRKADDIVSRQSLVRFFFDRPPQTESLRARISRVKDIERLITRAESGNISLPLFLDLIDSFELLQGFIDTLKEAIKGLTVYDPIERYARLSASGTLASAAAMSEDNMVPEPLKRLCDELPDLEPMLSFFGFDRTAARRDNMITPLPGTNPDFDKAQSAIESHKQKLDEMLRGFRRQLKDSTLAYYNSKTENYTIVVKSAAPLPSDWTLVKELKAGNRYRVESVMEVADKLQEAEADLNRASANSLLTCLQAFTAKFAHSCAHVISVVAQLDVLMSLARYACNAAGETEVCQPEPLLVKDSPDVTTSPLLMKQPQSASIVVERPLFQIKSMKHPFLVPKSGPFIPNDLALGSAPDSPPILLVTGPNMGGKSTLLRQACILTIMAQLGSFVPAEACRFTPVDRIFTRIGARDNLVAGQSTFMIELEETSKILSQATPHSLVILDELGRGTSTFDGYSIAYSVLKYFESQSSRVLFSTHYHKLTQEFNSESDIAKVQQGHMECQNRDGEMVFLYRLVSGPCPESFGLEVASLAHIPNSILMRASSMSDMFEAISLDATATPEALKRFSFRRLLLLLSQPPTTSSGSDQLFKTETVRLWRLIRNLREKLSSSE